MKVGRAAVFVPAIVYLNLVSPHRPLNLGNPWAFHPNPFSPGHSFYVRGVGRWERGREHPLKSGKEREREEGQGERDGRGGGRKTRVRGNRRGGKGKRERGTTGQATR